MFFAVENSKTYESVNPDIREAIADIGAAICQDNGLSYFGCRRDGFSGIDGSILLAVTGNDPDGFCHDIYFRIRDAA
jgi:hypothetical protein